MGGIHVGFPCRTAYLRIYDFYFAITLTLYFYNKPIIMNELISFAKWNMVRSSENVAGS